MNHWLNLIVACFLTPDAHDLLARSPRAPRGKKKAEMWRFSRFWRFWLSFRVKLKINFVLQTVLFSWNQTFTEVTWCGGDVNIVRYQVAVQNF